MSAIPNCGCKRCQGERVPTCKKGGGLIMLAQPPFDVAQSYLNMVALFPFFGINFRLG